MNVLIICSAGMSSSLLATNLRKIAVEKNRQEIKFGYCSINQAKQYVEQADMILLAPQLDFLYHDLKKESSSLIVKKIPVSLYGMKNRDDFIGIFDLVESNTAKEEPSQMTILTTMIRKITHVVIKNKELKAINNGMLSILPISLLGSIFVLVSTFIVTANLNNSFWSFIKNITQIGIDGTTGIISIYVACQITYDYARQKNMEPTTAILNTFICYFMLIGSRFDTKILDITYMGIEGLFSAIIIAIISTNLFEKVKKITKIDFEKIRSPHNIIILESLSSVIPIFVSILLFILFNLIFQSSKAGSFPQWVYDVLHTRISMIVSNNVFSAIIINLISNVLWFFGIHGGQITNTVTSPIYTVFSYENLAAYNLGEQLPNIINKQFGYMYTFGGAGSTFGLVLLMTFFAKSERLRNVGKISLPLSFFFINETVLFGVPMVLNVVMLVPFIFITPFLGLLTYLATKYQLIPYVIGVDIPWYTPLIISGLIEGGIKLALWQILMVILSIVLYYPFFKIQDRIYYLEESK